jgi:GTP-binding protein
MRRTTSVLAKQSYSVVQSATESVFTYSLVDPELVQFSQWRQSARELFSLEPRYLSPKDLNYILPNQGVPEFAFVGRSNVGKSSLINALLGCGPKSKLVRISKEPGCTKNVNYFSFSRKDKPNSHALHLVDLPGYGFAKQSKQEQKKWEEMITAFLLGRDQSVMRRTFMLVDSRLPIKESDKKMMDVISKAKLPFQVILTKSDQTSQPQLFKCLETVFEEITNRGRVSCMPFVHVVSSKTGYGIEDLMDAITDATYGQHWGHTTTSSR